MLQVLCIVSALAAGGPVFGDGNLNSSSYEKYKKRQTGKLVNYSYSTSAWTACVCVCQCKRGRTHASSVVCLLVHTCVRIGIDALPPGQAGKLHAGKLGGVQAIDRSVEANLTTSVAAWIGERRLAPINGRAVRRPRRLPIPGLAVLCALRSLH